MNPITNIFESIGPLKTETIDDLKRIIKNETFPKNAMLLEIGNRAKSIFFLKTGFARAFYYHDGKDVTDYFAIEGQFFGAVPSLINGQPSLKGIQLIEDSDIFYFSALDFETLCAKHHDLEHVGRMMAIYGLQIDQEIIESLRFYSMKERYELLERKFPGIMNRCPLHYIASYLGTSQVSISRIRAGVQ
ncbi:MAG: Crp/Fnr family transcriptional regulator [Saprospiraceae bacterium]|nr:Crp/Fnr family transcriptional regulator [Saprospiraceae bacterium]